MHKSIFIDIVMYLSYYIFNSNHTLIMKEKITTDASAQTAEPINFTESFEIEMKRKCKRKIVSNLTLGQPFYFILSETHNCWVTNIRQNSQPLGFEFQATIIPVSEKLLKKTPATHNASYGISERSINFEKISY